MKRLTFVLAVASVVGLLLVDTLFAQRMGGAYDLGSYTGNVRYDGKFVFVRMSYPENGFRRQPFWAHDYPEGETHFMKILNEDPAPITEVRQDVPPIVINMVSKCMRKKREDRYQTAAELVNAIGYLLSADYEARETSG